MSRPVELQVNQPPVETTLYSLSHEPPRPSERRSGERLLTLFRVGAILIGDRRELCLIRNISAGGMMLRIYAEVHIGERVSIELKNGVPVAGKVSWVRDGQVGIAFDAPIDVLEILSNDDGPRPRMPRIETHAQIMVRQGARTCRVRCCDISQGGVKVEWPAELAPDGEVIISLPGNSPQPGMIRWVAGGLAGLSFNKPMPLADLVSWLQAQREERAA